MKKSKAFDMRYHWLKDRIAQKEFNLYWSPGKTNSADYFSKHHPPAHHKLMRSQYLQRALAAHLAPSPVRGCVSPRRCTSGFLDPPDTQLTSRSQAPDSQSPLISLIY
jgi:hypothetical protein